MYAGNRGAGFKKHFWTHPPNNILENMTSLITIAYFTGRVLPYARPVVPKWWHRTQTWLRVGDVGVSVNKIQIYLIFPTKGWQMEPIPATFGLVTSWPINHRADQETFTMGHLEFPVHVQMHVFGWWEEEETPQ